MDRRYLRRIAEHHAGGPVGVETLAAALAEARDTLEDVVEPFLIQEGLVLRTSRGRMLGEPGWRHLGLSRRRRPALLSSIVAGRWMNEHPASIPPEGRHRYTVRVYYEDTDAGGIVYHATYLRFAERARTEALRDLGVPHAELLHHFNLMFVVRRVEVDYLRPARVDDSLVVETGCWRRAAPRRCCARPCSGAEGACAVLEIRLACVASGGNAISGPRRSAGSGGRLPPRWRAVLQAMRDARPADRRRVGAGEAAGWRPG